MIISLLFLTSTHGNDLDKDKLIPPTPPSSPVLRGADLHRSESMPEGVGKKGPQIKRSQIKRSQSFEVGKPQGLILLPEEKGEMGYIQGMNELFKGMSDARHVKVLPVVQKGPEEVLTR